PTSATCTSESCLNGGTCLTDASGESRCSCPENYIGADCSESISCTSDAQCGNKTCKVYQGQNYCDCRDDLTGFFCDVAVSQGDTRLYRSEDLGNVASLNRFGSGSLISGTLKDPCLVAPYNCTEGLTVSFWLQFISGGIIIHTGKAGLHVYVEGGKFFITYQGVDRSWTIERACIPMGVFLVTATWSAAGGLSYYENGKPVVSTQISDLSSISGNFDDVITVGYEETSSGKRYSSLIIDDLMIWNRALSSGDVRTIYDAGVSTSFGRASCLSGPCESGSWCVQGASSTEHGCLQPTSSDCSFEDDLCGFNGFYATITSTNSQSAIIENMPYHDHTFGNCTGNKSYRRVNIVVYFTFWAQFHVRVIDGFLGVFN
ncbi:macrophage mannose receptor 1-like, partial [Paramuricea clavata]